MRARRALFVVLGALLAASGLALAQEPIPIGLLLPYTGPLGWVAAAQVGVEIALDEINSAGGPLGRPVKVYIQDTEGVSTAAVAGARNLIGAFRVVAIIGPTSAEIRSVLPITLAQKIPEISPTAGTTALDFYSDSRRDGRPFSLYKYRTVSSDVTMGTGMAVLARELGARRAALFFADDEGSQSIRGVVQIAARVVGLEVAADIVFPVNQPSYRTEILRLMGPRPDVIFFESGPEDAGVIFQQAFELGLETRWIGTDFVNDVFVENTFPASSQVVYAAQPAPLIDDRYRAFVREVERRRGQPGEPLFTSNAYDALNILALAIEAAGTTDGPAIAENIRKVANPPGVKVYNFREGARALRAGQDIDYVGIAGPQDFNDYGDVVTYLAKVQVVPDPARRGKGMRQRIGTYTEADLGETLKSVMQEFQRQKGL